LAGKTGLSLARESVGYSYLQKLRNRAFTRLAPRMWSVTWNIEKGQLGEFYVLLGLPPKQASLSFGFYVILLLKRLLKAY
jgi:hypothetical protein